MTEHELKNIEFYRDQYLFEHERRKYYDGLIQYPTTLLVIFIGAALYSFNKYFKNGFEGLYTELDWIFIVLFCLFAISTIITICFLGVMFHGFTRRYYYLPHSGHLEKYEKDLYEYFYKYSNEKTFKKKREDAKAHACEKFTKNLKKYYIDNTQNNQIVNDKRAFFFYRTRAFLFLDLTLLIILGTIIYLK